MITIWPRTLSQHSALVRMILRSWITTIPCLSFNTQGETTPIWTRQSHLHWGRLLDFSSRMTISLICPIIYAAHLPHSTLDPHHPPSVSDVLMSCHRFIRQHLPMVRMRSRRCLIVLQFHILFDHIPGTFHSWGLLPKALIRHLSILQIFLQLRRQHQQRKLESAPVAIGKIVITKLRMWMRLSG